MESRQDGLSPLEKINYPLDLIASIAETRRIGRVNASDSEAAQFSIQDGYTRAERMAAKSPGKKAEYWVTYHTVNGQLAYVGDFLELARINPEVAGYISPQQMYALLAIAYQRAADRLTRGKLEFPAALGRTVSEDQANAILDERSFLMRQAEDFKNSAGATYQQVLDRVNLPDFDQFRTRVGYRLNPDFLEKRL
ncbi:MAG: hypothetical protein G01um10145_150 [Microgenomates group bacterium Gr01-1014_5]|nr:MAG: hypothetical protein G01um10145_150 [Microgenomates group bacterium Gr01-1014_5]